MWFCLCVGIQCLVENELRPAYHAMVSLPSRRISKQVCKKVAVGLKVKFKTAALRLYMARGFHCESDRMFACLHTSYYSTIAPPCPQIGLH